MCVGGMGEELVQHLWQGLQNLDYRTRSERVLGVPQLRMIREFVPEVSHSGLPEGHFETHFGFGMGHLWEFCHWCTRSFSDNAWSKIEFREFGRELALELEIDPRPDLELDLYNELALEFELEIASQRKLEIDLRLEIKRKV